jgi:hypothetical protein
MVRKLQTTFESALLSGRTLKEYEGILARVVSPHKAAILRRSLPLPTLPSFVITYTHIHLMSVTHFTNQQIDNTSVFTLYLLEDRYHLL